jgi:hypothetical protein
VIKTYKVILSCKVPDFHVSLFTLTYYHDSNSRIPEWTSEGKEVNIKLSLCLSTITGEYIRNMV